jgi:murein DD-endopeptidase MepM/ murein hydrolase activator NlpD
MARSFDAESLLELLIAGVLTGLTLGALVVASAFLRAGEQAGEVAISAPARPARALPALPGGERLVFPVEGVALTHLQDTFDQARGNRLHAALDIAAPRGAPVRAVDEGRIARLSTGVAAGIAIDLLDPTGRYCYFYAHLDGYAAGLTQGQAVTRGRIIGYVGMTGNARATRPHLHFAVFELEAPGPSCFSGRPLNPYSLFLR